MGEAAESHAEKNKRELGEAGVELRAVEVEVRELRALMEKV